MPSQEPRVSVSRVSKIFADGRRQIPALAEVSLEVLAGRFVALLGPSGCGKTTLLRMVAGLETPSDGDVLVNGFPVVGPGGDRGMVFQAFSCFPWLTVRGNVEYALRLRGVVDRRSRAVLAEEFLGKVGLSGFGEAYPRTLSGGMQQRLAIARTLAREPDILLMDEPFGSLDSQTRSEMQDLLLQVWTGAEKTVLFVTHDVEEALFLADTVVIMTARPGRVRTEIQVPIARPRRPDVKMEPEFVSLRREVTAVLRT